MWDVRKVLRFPTAYGMFRRLIGGNARTTYLRDHIQPEPGMRVLDLGCGPADILDDLPAVEYVGIDISPEYIQAARDRFGKRGMFRCEDLTQTVLDEPASFDLVLAAGVLHHLPDDQARNLLHLAAGALRATGRLVLLDGCFVPEQKFLARFLVSMDRGRFVRRPEAYRALAVDFFGDVQSVVRHDLLRVAYTLHIMICRQPAREVRLPARQSA